MAFRCVPLNTLAFSYIPREKANNATGLINLARNIGGSSGIAFVMTQLARRSQFHQHVLVSHATVFDRRYNEMLRARLTDADGARVERRGRRSSGARRCSTWMTAGTLSPFNTLSTANSTPLETDPTTIAAAGARPAMVLAQAMPAVSNRATA